ncbi:MAG TPA: intradiol ring-cleavage dioxygenase [Thermoanaerobaculia bacterium]|nr:intradiol ring-cleavage dioxygenase [Thermoanaerobaculia bacterium]
MAGQSRPDLFRCEGCEAIHENSFEGLGSSTTIPPAGEPGERMVLRGRVLEPDGETPAASVVVYAYHTNAAGVYPRRGDERGWDRRHGYLRGWVLEPDGETPAAGVVVYAYHTNAAGVYPRRGDERGWDRQHGYLRGWVKTDGSGEYRFETIRPAPYPGGRAAAHIHLTVKEPDRKEYWIDDVVFTDDPAVTAAYRARQQDRGGSGIVTPERGAEGTWQVRRDIVLEP